MKETKLFIDKKNNWITSHDLLKKLEKIDAHDCNILYIHTATSFGTPNPELSKNELLQTLLDVILELKVPTICLPTFTFSFCNGNDFDVTNSKSKMGALNEFVRKQPTSLRSVDPLMSVTLIGEDKDLVTGIGHNSCGKGSTFDKLHYRDKVRFLFLGTKIGDCFTYMHYMEDYLKVPYRYDREFTGKIITPAKTYEDAYTLFVRYKNIFPGAGSYLYEDILLEKGIAKKELCGDSFVISVDEPRAFEVYAALVKKEPNYFITPGSVHDFDKTFFVKDMVAL